MYQTKRRKKARQTEGDSRKRPTANRMEGAGKSVAEREKEILCDTTEKLFKDQKKTYGRRDTTGGLIESARPERINQVINASGVVCR